MMRVVNRVVVSCSQICTQKKFVNTSQISLPILDDFFKYFIVKGVPEDLYLDLTNVENDLRLH